VFLDPDDLLQLCGGHAPKEMSGQGAVGTDNERLGQSHHSVGRTDPVSDVRSFAKANGVTWPLLSDPGNRISSAYRVVALPQSFVIRPNGTLAAHLYGGVTAAGLERVIDG